MQLPAGVGVRVLGLSDLPASGAAALLEGGGVLELDVPAAPAALIAQLQAEGLHVDLEPHPLGCRVRLGRRAVPPLVVLTELEAPEPMRRVLAAFAALEGDAVFLALLPHPPVPLFPLLNRHGACWDVATRPDGTALLWVTRGTP